MRHPRPYKAHFPFFPVFFIIAILGLGLVVRFLWNTVLVAVLSVTVISYWQAVGLLALCRILFGSFGGPGSRQWGRQPGPHRFGNMGGDPSWRSKWKHMTDEERAKFRQEMINRRKNRFDR